MCEKTEKTEKTENHGWIFFLVGCIIGIFAMSILLGERCIEPMSDAEDTLAGGQVTKRACSDTGCSFLTTFANQESRWVWIPANRQVENAKQSKTS